MTLVGSVLLVVVLISVAIWVPLIRRLTRGLNEVTRAAEQIAEGRFEIQVPADRPDELGQLGASVNRMAGRLSGFVQGQKRFLGDIAHELSSPIARINFALGALEQDAGTGQLEPVKDLREEVEHMSGLVAELRRAMSKIEADLKHRTPDWEQRMAAWEKSVAGNQPEWIVLR